MEHYYRSITAAVYLFHDHSHCLPLLLLRHKRRPQDAGHVGEGLRRQFLVTLRAGQLSIGRTANVNRVFEKAVY